jgi:CheY-like chemotaxis protein
MNLMSSRRPLRSKKRPRAAADAGLATTTPPSLPIVDGDRGGKKKSSHALLVLIVDDFPDAREMYGELLQFSGFRIAEAADGIEAVEMAKELRPALIIMDLMMPRMDGWTATRILKGHPRTWDIPIIAITAHALAADEERARREGCDGFIAKPSHPSELLTEIQRLLEAR